jgi:hypothetical protein
MLIADTPIRCSTYAVVNRRHRNRKFVRTVAAEKETPGVAKITQIDLQWGQFRLQLATIRFDHWRSGSGEWACVPGLFSGRRNPQASPSICRTRYSDVIFHHHGPSLPATPPAQAVKAGRELPLAPGPLFLRMLGLVLCGNCSPVPPLRFGSSAWSWCGGAFGQTASTLITVGNAAAASH